VGLAQVNLRLLAEMLYRLDTSPDSMLRDWREVRHITHTSQAHHV